MIIPCDVPCQTCVPPGGSPGNGSNPADPDYPFINLSSEAPDVDNFIGKKFGPPPGDGGGGPPLGNYYYAIGCLGWCISAVSQEEANLCAARQDVECLGTNWPPPPPGNPKPPNPPLNPTFPPMTIYRNTPQSCDFTCPDGSVFTYTVPAGTFFAFNQAAANATAHAYACQNATAQRLCVGDVTPSIACANETYAGALLVSSTQIPLTFTVIGDLPPGLFGSPSVLNGLVFNLNGVVDTPGDYDFVIRVTDANGHVMNKSVTLTFFGIVTDSTLPEATVDSPYLLTLLTAGTVTGSVTYRFAGVLPDGLTFDNATGIISGTPAEGSEGEYNFTITARARGVACSKDFFMTVEESSPCPDWANDLIFGVPFVSTGITFTPGAGPSNTFSFQGVGDPFNLLEGTNTGSFVYNGPGCNCVVHGEVVIRTGDFSRQNSQVMFTSSVIGVFFIADLNLAAGVYDFPFSLPDTMGVPHTITVNVYGSLDQLFAGQAEWNGYIDNVP